MDQSPLPSFEQLLIESLDQRALRKKFGLPHPLHKFAANGGVKDNAYADAILEFLNDHVWAEPESVLDCVPTQSPALISRATTS
jgi:hypothetical protein